MSDVVSLTPAEVGVTLVVESFQLAVGDYRAFADRIGACKRCGVSEAVWDPNEERPTGSARAYVLKDGKPVMRTQEFVPFPHDIISLALAKHTCGG